MGKRLSCVLLGGVLCAALLASSCEPAPPPATKGGLWPPIEPFESGHYRVSPLHEIYYELSGSPQGLPVFGLHGGPGGESSPYMRRFFDPDRWLIVLHDQRGAGKSLPSGELKENDTWALVEDIENLRVHLKLDGIVLFGGSWGSTLALAYAEKYPGNVAGLVLRGVFTARREEIDYFYHGGAAAFFPDQYAKLLETLPDPGRRPLPDYLHELIVSTESPERDRYCRAWAWYEFKISGLRIDDQEIEKYLDDHDPCVFALFENYYMKHRCFLEEGQLLEEADRLAGIPTYIVNGRYDAICPPQTAHELHLRIPGSKLSLVDDAGHWLGEPGIQSRLLEVMDELADRL